MMPMDADFFNFTAPINTPPPSITTTIPTDSLNASHSRKNYTQIINDKDLFWQLFCKIYADQSFKPSEWFNATRHVGEITISGLSHIIPKIQQTVEEIRLLAARALNQHRNITILMIEVCGDFFIREKCVGILDLKDCWLSDHHFKIAKFLYIERIDPCVQPLFASLGARCKNVEVRRQVRTSCLENIPVKGFEITWEKDHYVYPIPANPMTKRGGLDPSLYQMYQNQILCDFTLTTEEESVKIHPLPLYIHGGEAIQTLLTCNMEETAKKEIIFDRFPKDVIRAFVDYLYLGESALEPETFFSKEVDLYMLLRFAHTYQIKPLLLGCTNLISLVATADDAETITTLAALYNNDHLRALHRHLQNPQYLLMQQRVNPGSANTIAIDLMEAAHSRKDYPKIINDKDLFWQLFCKIYTNQPFIPANCFHATRNADMVTISGQEHIITEIQQAVEEIRLLAAPALNQNRNTTILMISPTGHFFIREKCEGTLDLSNWLNDSLFKIYNTFFRDHIEPCMPSLFASLGAQCKSVRVWQQVRICSLENIPVKGFEITWGKDHYVYPVPANPMTKRGDLDPSLYQMYKNQILCDFTLTTEGESLKIHQLPLFIHGGEAIQTLLTSNMEETAKKEITFDGFPKEVIRAFVDYLYLGESALEPETFFSKEVDLYKLLRFAHTYQIKPLLDCCTNLISLVADDADTIAALAALYQNEHLRALHRHLLALQPQ